jgi:hypothetical protein
MRCLLVAAAAMAMCASGFADLIEGFDDITTLVPGGWYMQNNSSPAGSTDWFQGNADVFAAHEGAPTAYLGANYNNCGGNPGVISNWLLTPELTLQNGDTVTFWTRTVEASGWPDRMQLRMSLEGGSTDVGTGPFDVGDFTTLLLDINPNYDLGGYPEAWTSFTVELDGLGAPTNGRFALRYFVEDAGPSGNNSNYIGIDTFAYTVPTPGVLALLGLAGLVRSRRR